MILKGDIPLCCTLWTSLNLFYCTSDYCACALLTAHISHLIRTQLFQSYWSSDILHRNLRLLLGNSMVVLQILFTNLTFLTYDWFTVIILSECDGCHTWGRKWNTWYYSLWGVLDFNHSLYIHYRMCLLCLRIWFQQLPQCCLRHMATAHMQNIVAL